MHRIVLAIAMCFALGSFAKKASAVPAPKYLAVPDFKLCLGTKTVQGYQSWCMPGEQPQDCPTRSWAQLDALAGSDRLPACEGPTGAAVRQKTSDDVCAEFRGTFEFKAIEREALVTQMSLDGSVGNTDAKAALAVMSACGVVPESTATLPTTDGKPVESAFGSRDFPIVLGR